MNKESMGTPAPDRCLSFERQKNMSEERSKKTVNVFCPSLAKMVSFVVWDEQKLDLGSIARTFGLDPATLKLNGHFISRGVDLIASSVTWKSLLAFFSARGLSTGSIDSDALVLDGKLLKVGSKRGHNGADFETEICYLNGGGNCSAPIKSQIEDANFLKKKRPGEFNSGYHNGADQVNRRSGFCLKRKQLLDDISLVKRTRTKEIQSDSRGLENDFSGIIPNTQCCCSFVNGNMK